MSPDINASLVVEKGDFHLNAQFSIPAQGVTALFGPSGCGKTTLLRAIAGLEAQTRGELHVAGEAWQNDHHGLPPHQRPVGYVFQESSLFEHLTVRRNIAYGHQRLAPGQRRVSLQQAIALLGIEDLLDRYPHSLSGGERQRVAIARAIAVSPRLLLMDEPLAALDQARKQEVLPFIQALHRQLDIPVLYVSHALEEVAQIAQHLVLMQQGRVIGSGAIQQMFTRLDLPLAQELDASAILDATVIGFEPAFHLTRLRFAAGEMLVSAQHLKPGEQLRLRLVARDVSLTLQRQHGTSILNIFPATVDGIADLNPSQVTVRLLAGDAPLLSRITKKSAAELGLRVGMQVYAQVKSVALLP